MVTNLYLYIDRGIKMNVVMLSTDNALVNLFKNNKQIEAVTPIHEYNEFITSDLTKFGLLIISDKLANFSCLEEIRDKVKNDAFVCYMMSNYPDSAKQAQIKMVCLSKNIQLIPPKQTIEQISNKIMKIVFPGTDNRSSNVISLFGAFPRVGVTSLILSIAQRLSEISNIKVGVFGLNCWNPGDIFVKGYNAMYLDDIKNYLSNKMLSDDELIKNMFSVNRFLYMAGNRDIKKRLYFSIEEIHYLIDRAKNVFDLILLDSGSHYDNALTIQALICSDLKILVTTQEMSGINHWKCAFEQCVQSLGYTSDDLLLLVNKYQDSINLNNTKQLQEHYQIPFYDVVPSIGEEAGAMVEKDQVLLSECNFKEYNNAVDRIVGNIVQLYGIEVTPGSLNGKKGFLNRIFKK